MLASWIALAIVVAGAIGLGIATLLGGIEPGAGTEQLVGVIVMVALAVWIGPGVLARYRGRGGQALQHVALWLAIVVAILLLYRYRGTLFPS
jgi:hypothetical protein